MFKVYDHFYKDCYKQQQISMRGRGILAAPPIPLTYENTDTYENLRGIGCTPNTLGFESRHTDEGPPEYWRHRQYPSSMKIHIRLRGPGILAALPIPSCLKVEMRMRAPGVFATPPIPSEIKYKKRTNGPQGIGSTANTLEYEIINTYKSPPGHWGTANTFRYDIKNAYKGTPG